MSNILTTDRFDLEVLRLVNIERAKLGRSALTLSQKLDAAADLHSEDMATNGYFSHTGQDNSNVGTRIFRAGYTRYRTWGENIAVGYRSAASVVQGWMNSEGHRRNILNGSFTHMGLGTVANDFGRLYWTQVFAAGDPDPGVYVPQTNGANNSPPANPQNSPSPIPSGTSGRDTLTGSSRGDKLSGLGGNDRLNGLGGNDTLLGGSGNDTVLGGSGNDRLIGGSGNDRLSAQSGNDTLSGGSGRDTLTGGGGSDRLSGNDQNDVLKGQSGNDTLLGGTGNDLIRGGKGNDVLDGQQGQDTLIGGTGRDRFKLRQNSGLDLIQDFENGKDSIQLTGGLTFSGISLRQSGRNVSIFDANNNQVAVVANTNLNQLNAADFV
ncbi:MAG: CAP domain-containing protein [Synechococcus sp.]